MTKVVNLNKFRKQRAKVEREQQAETNKRLHGRSKAERLLELKQKQLLDGKVNGARLSKPSVPLGPPAPLGPRQQPEPSEHDE